MAGNGKLWLSDLSNASDRSKSEMKEPLEELRLCCTSWRFAAETNNLSPWRTIPPECAGYVEEYMTGRGYRYDLERVSKEARVFANSVKLGDDGRDIWIFDVDETLLSNLPYYALRGYGLEVFNPAEFDKWVEEGSAPAISSSLELYGEVLKLGFKVFFLSGRGERHRNVTVDNLIKVGFKYWDKLILRSSEDGEKHATEYKSEKRDEMVKEGYRIVANSGDQWSDLLGSSVAIRSFKLPNPMYYVP
ncbi:OLC1v1027107C1 [Oldenlandia corymbosa var. corymbosa]|uniref:OLC1v1027107C1 n=1 Tax=Oldenlandia corymbosa var. corymbosa TaxID=529605 RepID=A0AAV1C9X0_OLDCO|nr:OLC1v1027107C1 [Oldenlandia corymbosa var. corymbosa]